MTDAPDPPVGQIRVDIEAADAHDPSAIDRREEGLAGPVEAVIAVLPVVNQPAHEGEALALALGDQVGEAVGWQLLQAQ